MADTYIGCFVKVGRRTAGDLIGTRSQSDLRKLITVLNGIQGGTIDGSAAFVELDDSGTNPNGTVTVLGATVTTADTFTFTFSSATVVLTAGTDFKINTGSNNEQARYLSEGINENPFLRSVLVATVATNVVTITPQFPSDMLENITLSTNDATAFTISAIGTAQAGADGAAQAFFQGVDNR